MNHAIGTAIDDMRTAQRPPKSPVLRARTCRPHDWMTGSGAGAGTALRAVGHGPLERPGPLRKAPAYIDAVTHRRWRGSKGSPVPRTWRSVGQGDRGARRQCRQSEPVASAGGLVVAALIDARARGSAKKNLARSWSKWGACATPFGLHWSSALNHDDVLRDIEPFYRSFVNLRPTFTVPRRIGYSNWSRPSRGRSRRIRLQQATAGTCPSLTELRHVANTLRAWATRTRSAKGV